MAFLLFYITMIAVQGLKSYDTIEIEDAQPCLTQKNNGQLISWGDSLSSFTQPLAGTLNPTLTLVNPIEFQRFFSSDGGNTIIADTDNSIYKSTDRGKTWTVITTGEARGISGNGKVMIGITEAGSIISNDSGSTWRAFKEAAETAALSFDGKTILIAPSLGTLMPTIHQSNDYGKTWTPIKLPSTPMRSVGGLIIRISMFVSYNGDKQYICLARFGFFALKNQWTLIGRLLPIVVQADKDGNNLLLLATPDEQFSISAQFYLYRGDQQLFPATFGPLSMDYTGQYQLYRGTDSDFLLSSDFGATWGTITTPFIYQVSIMRATPMILASGSGFYNWAAPNHVISDIIPDLTADIGSLTQPFQNGYFANTVYANGIALTSTIDAKTNVQDLADKTDLVSQLRPVSYQFKGQTRQHYGFILEELPDPNLIDSKHMLYNELFAVLVQAIQKQQKQIDQLTAALNPPLKAPKSAPLNVFFLRHLH